MTSVAYYAAVLDRAVRSTPVSLRGKDFRLRRAAEHEAAHAVTAWALGLHVKRVQVWPDGTGECDVDWAQTTPVYRRPVALAGDLWVERFAERHLSDCYVRSCSDRGWLAAYGGDDFSHRETIDRTTGILKARRRQVLDLADELVERRTIRYTEQAAAPARRYEPRAARTGAAARRASGRMSASGEYTDPATVRSAWEDGLLDAPPSRRGIG